jgi:hypothetical protein
MNVLLIQLDGKLPNLALMRIAMHYRGDNVTLRFGAAFEKEFTDDFDVVYASAIFEKSRPLIARLKTVYPQAIVGGTGQDFTTTVEQYGIETNDLNYSLYPRFRSSIGFTQRGCRLKCPFCVVPKKEGAVRFNQTIAQIWRGEPWPRELLLLDNDFFGQLGWRHRIREIQEGNFKVSFNQGINARFLTEETAEAVASVDYRDDSMKVKRIYTAWDSMGDERRLFRGLELLCRYGVKPDHIMVYMLIGYWPEETHDKRDYRRRKLREFGARPYPMPYVRSNELIGFQRWVIGAYDKQIPWTEWQAAVFRPERLKRRQEPQEELPWLRESVYSVEPRLIVK